MDTKTISNVKFTFADKSYTLYFIIYTIQEKHHWEDLH